MAATQQQRDGIGALTSRMAISQATPDRGSINAARINGAETRADAQLDDVIATIGARMYSDAAEQSPAIALRCIECNREPAGAVGRTGTRYSHICQGCLNDADRRLEASRERTNVIVDRVKLSLAKPKPPVLVEGQRLVCTCGCAEFSRVRPMADEPEVNFKGHRGGFDCDGCGKFFEHPEADFVDEHDRYTDEQATRAS